MKKKFKETRSKILECLKETPEGADTDDDESFSFIYWPEDRGPDVKTAVTVTLYFYPKTATSGSSISLSLGKYKD